MRGMRVFLALLFLTACARLPLSADRSGSIDSVAAASLLGDELTVNVRKPKVFGSGADTFDVPAWNVDASFRDLLKGGVEERGRHYVPFDLDPKVIEKAAGVRETRWKKIVGRQSQPMLDLLFDAADRQGTRYFFLITPPLEHETYLLHRGNYGAACGSDGRATVYFFFDFALWDVSARKKIFTTKVDPGVTEALTFGDCSVIANLLDPARQLEDPLKKTMGLVVDALFDKMGWGKPGGK
jgi:hypothetical protein